MWHESNLTERQREKLKMSFLVAATVGLVKAACGVLQSITTEAVRRGLGWEDEPDEDEDDPGGDV